VINSLPARTQLHRLSDILNRFGPLPCSECELLDCCLHSFLSLVVVNRWN